MKNTIEIIKEFARQVKEILGENLVQVILYGSYARGDYRENSDIDIMILTRLTDQQIEQVENRIYDLAFDFQMEYFICKEGGNCVEWMTGNRDFMAT